MNQNGLMVVIILAIALAIWLGFTVGTFIQKERGFKFLVDGSEAAEIEYVKMKGKYEILIHDKNLVEVIK